MISKDEKNAIVALAGVLTAVVVIAALALGWPAWVWVPLCLLPGIGAAVLAKQLESGRRPGPAAVEVDEEPLSPPDPEPHQEVFSEVSLPSAAPDYRFLVSGTVHWRPNPKAPGREHHDLAALARDGILSRAGESLLDAQPREHGALGERLNAELGVEQVVSSGHVVAWGGDFTVVLPEADRQRLQQIADVRKDAEVWEHERNHERDIREYLGEDVLSSPGSAVVWVLARYLQGKNANVGDAVNDIENVRDLTAAAQETDIPPRAGSGGVEGHAANGDGGLPSAMLDARAESGQVRIRPLIAWIDEVFAARPEVRELFVPWQAGLLDKCGNHEEAEALRAHFDLEPLPEEAAATVPAENGSGPAGDRRDPSTC